MELGSEEDQENEKRRFESSKMGRERRRCMSVRTILHSEKRNSSPSIQNSNASEKSRKKNSTKKNDGRYFPNGKQMLKRSSRERSIFCDLKDARSDEKNEWVSSGI